MNNTQRLHPSFRLTQLFKCACVAFALLSGHGGHAGVLPEDRAEVLYHNYEGGGVKIDGPSFLVRKKIGESVSLSGTYDIDMVSSASIDVMSSASPYKEHRKQWSGGGQYLRGKTTYSTSFLRSDEPDYLSDNLSFSVSEDMFGDLTTVTLGFTRGWDDVKQHIKTASTSTYVEKGRMDRRNYRIGLSQILTKKLIADLSYESIAYDGYQQNPYRTVRYCTTPGVTFTTLSSCTATASQEERYPRTRTSNAVGIEARYYLPYRASIKGGYRFYSDTWGIHGHTGNLEYVHPIGQRIVLEAGVRYYTQNAADFYADLFPYPDAQNFLARDRNLSTMRNITYHLGGDYKIPIDNKLVLIISGFYDRVEYTYDDFRNNLVDAFPTQQPLYTNSANVWQAQFSVQY